MVQIPGGGWHLFWMISVNETSEGLENETRAVVNKAGWARLNKAGQDSIEK